MVYINNRSFTGGSFEILHSHHSYELLLIHDGYGELLLDGVWHGLKPGLLCFFSLDEIHHCRITEGPFVRSVVDFTDAEIAMNGAIVQGAMADIVKNLGLVPSRVASLESDEVLGIERRIGLIDDLNRAESAQGQLHRDIAFTELLCETARLLAKGSHGLFLRVDAVPDPLVKSAISLINRDPAAWDTERLANTLICSKFSLCRRFKRATGMTISRYAISLRIGEACRLLRGTDLPVSEIGRRVGCRTPSYFTALFLQETGAAPSEYRRNRQS
jgi:AraC-like DNA-binding protein